MIRATSLLRGKKLVDEVRYPVFRLLCHARILRQKLLGVNFLGDILVYNDTQWVSWVKPSTYLARRSLIDAFNFGGTSDWAIDLNIKADYIPHGLSFSDYQVCDYALKFASLDDLLSEAGNFRSDCQNAYTLQVLRDTLDNAYQNYSRVNNDYDEMFGYYVSYMHKLVPDVLNYEFMFNASATPNDYVSYELGPGMAFLDCAIGKAPPVPCSSVNGGQDAYQTTALTLRDHDGYMAALTKVGLDPEWVTFGPYDFQLYDSGKDNRGGWDHYSFTGFPVPNTSMVIPNPKDIITKGLGSIPDLQIDIAATYMDILLGQWVNGSTSDPSQAYSAPIFMLMQGVDSMQQAKDLGTQEQKEEEEEAKRKKNFIILIVSVVLMFVPVVGEELALAAGFASLARAIAIAGEVGNAALGIYETVEDPKSAIVNILGMLIGVGAIARASRDGKGLADVARLRRGMGSDAISSLGKIFKDNGDKLQTIARMCKVE